MVWESIKKSLTVRIILTLSKITGLTMVLTAIVWGSVGIATIGEATEIMTVGVLLIGVKTTASTILEYRKVRNSTDDDTSA